MARTPRSARALVSSRACQSTRSPTSATRSIAAAGLRAIPSGERGIEQLQIDAAVMKALTAFDRRNGYLSRAEQHRIDRIEIALEALEDLRERLAIVARCRAGQPLGESPRIARCAGDKQVRTTCVDDRMIGSSHGGDQIGVRRRQGRRAYALNNTLERKFEFMGLMECHFENAGDDLNISGKALGGRADEAQAIGSEVTIACNRLHEGRGRRPAWLQHQRGAIGRVLVVELFE